MNLGIRPLVASLVVSAFGLMLVGCSSSAPSTTSGGGGGGGTSSGPQSSLSASSLTFANTNIGSSAATQSVTLTNTGSQTLVLTSAPTVADTANYSVATTCTASLAANAACTITVTFKPTTSSTLASTVSFADNSGNQTNVQHSFAVTGTGMGPVTSLSASALTFATVSIGSASAAQTVTLSNTGNAALTIGSVALADTTNYSMSTTCGTTLAAGTNCAIAVTFKPSGATSYSSKVTVTDNSGNGANVAHVINLTGTGALVNPTASLSTASVTFANTLLNTTSTAQTVTLTNTGANDLTVTGVALGGTNPTAFTQSNNCTTVKYNASCTITLAFVPTQAVSYAATLTITDNATPATQTVSLAGMGRISSNVSYQLYNFPDLGTGAGSGGVNALYNLVKSATKTVDMTMYILTDANFTSQLVAACQRGVIVRVILDQNSEKSQDLNAFNQINAQSGCTAVWANKSFQVTHQKSIVVDAATTAPMLAVMSLNLQNTPSQPFYQTSRDFVMIYNDPSDAAAVEATFNADFVAGTTAAGVVGASDYSTYTPQPGTDLIWSPTTAQVNMEKIINNATTTLIIDAEELTNAASYIATDVANACKRGVTVRFTIENQGGANNSTLTTMKNAGCSVRMYTDTSSTAFYLHAKSVIADYGLSTQSVYMGSINYSGPSLGSSSPANRELGMFITDQASVTTLYNAMVSDFNGGATF